MSAAATAYAVVDVAALCVSSLQRLPSIYLLLLLIFQRHMEASAEGLVSRAVSLEVRRSEAEKALQQLEERRLSLEKQLDACLAEVCIATAAATRVVGI